MNNRLTSLSLSVQDSEAAGDMSFAEYKRQRRAEQDDAEYPDEVSLTFYTANLSSCLCDTQSPLTITCLLVALFANNGEPSSMDHKHYAARLETDICSNMPQLHNLTMQQHPHPAARL